MKNLDLNAYGVQEMDAVEMKEINGGEIPWYTIGSIAAIGVAGLLGGPVAAITVSVIVKVAKPLEAY